jgi:CHAP domain
MTFQETLVLIAKKEIGTEEVGTSNAGPRVNEYKSATDLDPRGHWPWCAAFVCWCVREALDESGIKEVKDFHRPRTASAWGLADWSHNQGKQTSTKRHPEDDIQPGDIICYEFSHCGIALTSPDDRGYFRCIEGNTNDAGSREGGAVLIRTRRNTLVRHRIRFHL